MLERDRETPPGPEVSAKRRRTNSFCRQKHGYIDKNGKTVISVKYDSAAIFSDGAAVIWKNGTWYILDTKGNVIP